MRRKKFGQNWQILQVGSKNLYTHYFGKGKHEQPEFIAQS